jgi:hypothetical protein
MPRPPRPPPLTAADLPPPGSAPPPPPAPAPPPARGHNGGPPLAEPEPGRRLGRPRLLTPELRSAILQQLFHGVPLRVLCRAPGMPGRSTIYRWRREDPEFDRICASAQAEGHFGLVERVLAEVFELAERRGPRLARRWFNLRRQQLGRAAPRHR